MKYKEYNKNAQEDMAAIMTLLDEHEGIKPSELLTSKIMHAVNKQHHRKVNPQAGQLSFQMKLASSFICSGVFLLIANIVGFGQKMYWSASVMKGVDSLGSIITEVISQIGN